MGLFWDSQPQCPHRNLLPEADIEWERVGQEQSEGSWHEPWKQQNTQKWVAPPNPTTAASWNKVKLKKQSTKPTLRTQV
jgi:hypothetical protein